MRFDSVKMTQLPVRDIDIISSESKEQKQLFSGEGEGLQAILASGMRPQDTIEEIGGAIIAPTIEGVFIKANSQNIKLDQIQHLKTAGDESASSRELEGRELIEVEDISKQDRFKNVIKSSSQLQSKIDASSQMRAQEALLEEQRLRQEKEADLQAEKEARERLELELASAQNAKQKLEEIMREQEHDSGDGQVMLSKVLEAAAKEAKLEKQIQFKDKDIQDREAKISQRDQRIKELQQKISTSKASQNLANVNKSLEQQIKDLKEDKKRLEAKVPAWKVTEIRKKRERETKERERKAKAKRDAKKRQQQGNGSGVSSGSSQQTAKQNLQARLERMKQQNAYKPPEREKITITRSAEQMKNIEKTKQKIGAINQAQLAQMKSGQGSGDAAKKAIEAAKKREKAAKAAKASNYSWENWKPNPFSKNQTEISILAQMQRQAGTDGAGFLIRYLEDADRKQDPKYRDAAIKAINKMLTSKYA